MLSKFLPKAHFWYKLSNLRSYYFLTQRDSLNHLAYYYLPVRASLSYQFIVIYGRNEKIMDNQKWVLNAIFCALKMATFWDYNFLTNKFIINMLAYLDSAEKV